MGYIKNILVLAMLTLAVLVATLGCSFALLDKDDKILKEDKKNITVERYYADLIPVHGMKLKVKRDTTQLKFRQRQILAEGEIIWQAHYAENGKEHYFVIKDKKKNKNLSSPQKLECDIISWCQKHNGEYVKFAKEYYPKERYIIITKDNEIIY